MAWLFTGGVGEFGTLETLVLGTAGSRDASLNSDLDLSLGGPFKFSTCYSRLGGGVLSSRKTIRTLKFYQYLLDQTGRW